MVNIHMGGDLYVWEGIDEAPSLLYNVGIEIHTFGQSDCLYFAHSGVENNFGLRVSN